jgi:2-polyprenyl-3-methyl-5-hydroxy-6-metoxy-1,4-benzoquinol methylase
MGILILQYDKELPLINQKIKTVKPEEIPKLFQNVPLEKFGELVFTKLEGLEEIYNYLPSLPSEDIQKHWTGASGSELLKQSLAFMKTVITFLQSNQIDIDSVNLLDFGCGWGRFLRFFLKYIPEDRLFGVDPWDKSIEECILHRVRGNLEQIDWICRSLPFGNTKFDVVIAFSVFTHICEKSAREALHTLRSRMSDHAFIILTIRPSYYWEQHQKRIDSNIPIKSLQNQYKKKGFAFYPIESSQIIEGEKIFGDVTISTKYIKREWKEWKLLKTEINAQDPLQMIVFLQPQ